MSKAVTFIDQVKIYATAGNGGNGRASFRREKYVPMGGPDGGDGGRGGHMFLKADLNKDSLLDLYFHPHQRAGHGGHGGKSKCHGKNGEDKIILVPCGTVVTDAGSGAVFGELVNDENQLMIAQGGRGGLGNCHFVTPSHRAPREYTEGTPGEDQVFLLELKIMADVGLVGFPNAGKSTLLTTLTSAHPKTAAYPFTTMNPIIGMLEYEDYSKIRIADIPGLIEGAHLGTGLGHDFLRHLERTKSLVYVIDMAGTDGRNPQDDYHHLREELSLYRSDLTERPSLVVANKMDLKEAEENFETFTRETRINPLKVSGISCEGVPELKNALFIMKESWD